MGREPEPEKLWDVGLEEGFSVRSVIVLRILASLNVFVNGMKLEGMKLGDAVPDWVSDRVKVSEPRYDPVPYPEPEPE